MEFRKKRIGVDMGITRLLEILEKRFIWKPLDVGKCCSCGATIEGDRSHYDGCDYIKIRDILMEKEVRTVIGQNNNIIEKDNIWYDVYQMVRAGKSWSEIHNHVKEEIESRPLNTEEENDVQNLDSHMDFSYITGYYKVPAKMHGRIRYTGGKTPRLGTIVGSLGSGIRVVLDGDMNSGKFHPTWEIEYLSDEEGGFNPALLQENLHFLVHESDYEGSVYGLVQDFPDKEVFLNTVKFYLGDQGYTEEEVKFLEVQRDFYKFKHTYVEYADGDIVESEDPIFTRTEEEEEGSIEAYFVFYETKPGSG